MSRTGPTGTTPGTEQATLARLMWAIGQHESRGSYTVVNQSSGALGKWQVLPSNVPGWTKAALGRSLTPAQYLNSRSAQNKTVAYVMGQYLRQYGVEGTIAAWYGGPGVARNQSTWNNPVQDGPTIRQYVDAILSAMGQGGHGATATVGVPYRNPLRGLRNLQASRVDMGVDYSGSGPVYALGPGRITYAGTGNTGWGPPAGAAPGGFIGERLTAGPLKGKTIYVAEGVTPTVKVGQRVTDATQIGTVSGLIETGFAQPGGGTGTLAAQLGEIPASGDPGRFPTAAGAAYSRVLAWTGAPAGVVSGQPVGTSSAPGWLSAILGGIDKFFGGTGAAGVGAGVGGVAGAISGIGQWLGGLSTAVDWLLNPSNWVRIVAGVGGGVLVIGGVVALSHTGSTVQVPGGVLPPVRPAALPIGILMVGSGGVLLFIAFHNLPGSPANVGELLGSLRDEAQQTAAGVPAAA